MISVFDRSSVVLNEVDHFSVYRDEGSFTQVCHYKSNRQNIKSLKMRSFFASLHIIVINSQSYKCS